MKVVEYKLVQNDENSNLSQNVKLHLEEGWQPYGGPVSIGQIVAQAMVKYDKADEEQLFSWVEDIHHMLVQDLPVHIQNHFDHLSYPRQVRVTT